MTQPDTLTKTALSLFETGGPLMYPLALCSCAVIWLTVYNAIELRAAAFAPKTLLKDLQAPLLSHDIPRALSLLSQSKSRLARVLTPALEKISHPLAPEARQQAEAAIQETWDLELVRIQFWLNLLSTIAALSPMLGLLGTVSGMIKAFSKIGMGGMGKPELLAGDIGEALITTAAGLIVGIPAMVFFFILKSRLDIGESSLFKTITYLLDLCQDLPYARQKALQSLPLPPTQLKTPCADTSEKAPIAN